MECLSKILRLKRSGARQLELVSMEDRLLFSAAPGPAPEAPADNAQIETVIMASLEAPIEILSNGTAATNDSTNAQGLQPLDLDVDATTATHELVFIDTGAANYQDLLDDLWTHQDPDRHIDVVLLSSGEDGIAQITETLAQYRTEKVDAVHLVTHGADRAIKLGNTWLDAAALEQHRDQIASWGEALNPGADLLVYGCDLAGNDLGRALLNNLVDLTGADIAASIDETGSALLGGDWDLEYELGDIETEVAFSELTQEEYDGLLNTFLVTSTANSGAGTLRQAIADAQSLAGTDTISFASLGSGVKTINLTSTLTISSNVILDGWTAASYLGTPQIVLNGSSAGLGTSGITVTSGGSGSIIRGLVIQQFTANGILLDGANNVTIEGNYIGTDVSGLLDIGNGEDGIQLQNGASFNTIGGLTAAERNVISGNNNAGIAIDGATTSSNTILGNYIGIGSDGSTTLGNSHDGIHLQAATNTVIGSSNPAGRNVISGNAINGIGMDSAVGTVVKGNYIGTNAAGTAAVGNQAQGIYLGNVSTSNVIGTDLNGTNDATEGNLISGNADNGIQFWGSNVSSNAIRGNIIGLNATQSATLGNGTQGIQLGSGANSNVIGGTSSLAANVVAGNTNAGVELYGTGTSFNAVLGNFIGTNASSATGFGNGIGVLILGGASFNTIGGTTSSARNILSGNSYYGVDITGSGTDNNAVQGNYIGTNVAGTAALANGAIGVIIEAGASNNTIGGSPSARNIISGNTEYGVDVTGSTTSSNVISSNYVGLDATGTTAISNGGWGVAVDFNATGTIIGGTNVGDGNVISGNTNSSPSAGRGGIYVWGSNTRIQGNTIGLNAAGTAAVANGSVSATTSAGIWVNGGGTGNQIGGTTASAGNTIAGNVGAGIATDTSSNVVSIQGNSIYSNTGLGIDLANNGVTLNDSGDGDVGTNSLLNFPVIYTATIVGGNVTVTGEARSGATVEIFIASNDSSAYGEGKTLLGRGVVSGSTSGTVDSTARQFSFTFAVGSLVEGSKVTATATDVLGNTSEFSRNMYATQAAGVSVIPSVSSTSSETRVNTTTAGMQVGPDVNARNVAFDAAGNYVVVWQSANQDGSGNGVYAQRYNSSGVAQGGEILINETTAGDQDFESVAMANDGSFLVAWRSTQTTTYDIYARLFSSSGTAIDSEFLVNTGSTGIQQSPCVATDGTGTYVIAWESQASGNYDIYARRYSLSGTALGSEFLVNSNTTGDQRLSSISMNSSGDSVFVWSSPDASGDGVYARRYDNAGSALGNEFLVNQTTLQNQENPEVAMDEYGGFVVTWGSNASGSYDIYFRRYNGAGAATTNEVQVHFGNSVDQTHSVDVDSRGNFVVAWTSNLQDGSGLGIYAQRFSAAGIALGSDFLVNTTTSGNQTFPNVVFAPNDSFLIEWEGAGTGDTDGVFYKYYSTQLSTTESGGVASFQVVLDTAPTNGVNIGVTSSDLTEGTVSPPSMTFTSSTWNTPTTIFVTGANDALVDGNINYTAVLASATSLDTAYSGINPPDLTITNIDNDAPIYSISGTIYEDVDGDGQVSDDGVGLANAIVSIYLDNGDGAIGAGDTIVNSLMANSSGQYTFSGLADGNYWVVADSRSFIGTGGLNMSYSIHDQWAEQTYGSAGSVTFDGSSYSYSASSRTMFGGMRQDRSDNGASLLTGEHVTRVAVTGSNVAGVDYGFSYNVITNTRDGDEVAANNRTIQGSLRQFVQNSNALATTQSSNFQIGTGTQTISLTSILDNLSDTVILDASTQEGFSGTPLIVLDGNDAAGDGFHLIATADFSTIRGFVIRDFVGDAIEIMDGSDGNTIAGNYLGALTTSGTDAGATERNGESGLAISGANNTIGGSTAAERNVISGNNLEGIAISGTGATGNVIVGNYIGTTASGTGDLGNGSDGILIFSGASSNTIGGLNAADRNVISGNNEGIEINGSTTTLNVIQGNYIGLEIDGTTARGNDFDGIHISLGAHENTIGGTAAGARNVIAGSGANGIQIEGTSSDNNVVQGNFIGTDATGVLGRGNLGDGIRIGNGAQSNTIGGTAPEARNVISGNEGDGVDIQGTNTTGNVVQGNYIGTDGTGELDLGNTANGVNVTSSGNTIGGSATGAGNVVSGNNLRGIYVTGAGVSATIQGNYVGLDDDGLQAIGNSFDGIEVAFGAGGVSIQDNVVAANGQWGITLQGTGAGNTLSGNTVGLNHVRTIMLGGAGIYISTDGNTLTGNTIAGSNSYGIYLTGSANNTIQGNYIGTNSTGSTGIGNALQGIAIDGANSDNNQIGGTNTGEGNVIARNSQDGISIASGSGTGISILGNTIYGNGGLAIDLHDNGVTLNDANDTDLGANGLQNYPAIDSAETIGTSFRVTGSLNSTPSTTFRIEFYSSPSSDPSNHGEGQTYLGFINVTTDNTGNVTYNNTLKNVTVPAGYTVSATATNLTTNATSEFSLNALATVVNSAPTFSNGSGSVKTPLGVGDSYSYAVAVQPDGKILQGGYSFNGTDYDFVVARFNSDGGVDTSFGVNGLASTDFAAGSDQAIAILIQSDGKIVLCGVVDNAGDTNFGMVRYNTDGSIDTSFGLLGKVQTDFSGSYDQCNGAALQADGKIVLIGTSDAGGTRDMAVARYNSNGTLDTSFGGTGKVIADFGGGWDEATDVAIQSDGKIVVAGTSDSDFALGRFNTDGTLDTSFGGTGKVIASFGAASDEAMGLAIQSDGKIVVAGHTFGSASDEFAIARLNANGTLDATFGTAGQVTTDFGGNGDYAYELQVQADGKIVVAGVEIGTTMNVLLARYNSNGTLDSGFGSGGKVTADLGVSETAGYDITLQADGKILVVGYSSNGAQPEFSLTRFRADGSLDTSFGSSLNGQPTFVTGSGAVLLDSNVSIFDAELSGLNNFNGATLTLVRSSGTNSNDIFSASGNLDALVQGGDILLSGIAIGTVTTNSSGTLLLTFNNSATQARVNETLQSLQYSNTGGSTGAVQIHWTFSDGNSGAQGLGGALTASGSTTVTIVSTNNAPTIVASSTLNSISEDDVSNSGTLVSQMVDTEVTDADAGALKGIAITSAPTTSGTWEYTLNGTTWLSVGTPSTTAALLLPADSTTAIRFVPNSNFNGVSGLLNYKAWDQTSGTAGGTADVTFSWATTAFSTGTNGTSVSVSAVNDQPVFTSLDGAPTYVEGGAGVILDSNVSIFDAELSAIDDFDGATLTLVRQGGANPDDALAFDGVTVTTSGTDLFVGGVQVGTYLFTGGTLSIEFGAGTTNAQVNTVMQNIVYWNNSDNPPASVQIDWTFSDGNTGAQGSGGALSATGSTTINITPSNDAPQLISSATLNGINEDDFTNSGTLVSSLIATSFSDADAGALRGIAITYVDTSHGTWEYTLDGTNWLSIGTPTTTASLLLAADATTAVRFIPNADYAGVSGLMDYRAWDQTTGTAGGTADTSITGGSTAFSVGINGTSVSVAAVNDAPILTAGTVNNLIVQEDSGLTSLGLGGLTFAPGGGADEAGQTLTYQVTAIPHPTFFGSIYLADGTTLVSTGTYTLSQVQGMQFRPVANQNGGPSYFAFNVIDSGGTGNGGVNNTGFSIQLNITAANDAPSIATNTLSITEGAMVVLSSGNINATDADNSTAQLTYTVASLSGGQFELVASPGSSITTFTQGQINAGAVQFVHNGGESAPTYALTVSDGSLSNGPSTVSIGSFTNVNDAPVMTAPGVPASINEDDVTNTGTLVSDLVDTEVTDTDVSALKGIAVTFASTSNGTWQYTLDGTNWVSFGTPTNTSARLLAADATTRIRFVPSTNFNGTSGQIFYRAWDLTSGTSGGVADVTVNGGATAFSSTFSVTSLTVNPINDPPAISTNTLSITEGATVVLTSANINATDPDNTSAQLTYTASGISGGRFELVASPGTAITSFSQTQINSGAVQFVHYGGEAAPSYELTVSDGSLSDGPITVAIGTFTNTNDAPTVAFGQGDITHTEGNSTSTIDGAVSVTDIDSADFAGGTLTVTVSGGDVSDQLVVQHQGTGVGQVTVSGFNLYVDSGLGSVQVGTWSGGSGSPLVITFTSAATATEVMAVANAIGFQNLSSNPSSADRSAQFQLTDGDGGTSASTIKTIHFTTVNTSPTVSGPPSVTTNVDTLVTFSLTNGNAVSVNDLDAGLNPIQVRLSVTTGSLTLFTDVGLTFSVGDGLADQTMTMTGTVAAIQAAMDGLRYTPQLGFSGADRLIVEVDDLGNSGTTGSPLTATRGVNIYVGTVPFLQGDYLEVGFNGSGSIGSTLGAPTGYQSAGSILGVESDPERDGGTYDGDFVLPGSPVEGWGVHVGGATYSNNTSNYGSDDISGTWGAVSDTGTAQSMTWDGAIGGLNISSQYTVLRDGLYLEIVVTLTNSTASTLSDLYYYRNVDPDNNYDQNSDYSTTNTIISQGNDGGARSEVTAAQPDGSFMSLTGYGENSRVTYGGFANTDPLAIYNGTGLSQTGSAYVDEAISLAFHVPTLAAGQSTTLTLRYTFGNEAAPDVDLDGNDSTATGLNSQGLFMEDGGPVAIVDSDMTLFDADNDVLQGMTITLTNPLDGALESLAATTTGTNISASYDSGTGVLTLAGQDTLANYRHVLSSVVYDNSANTPNTTSRVITIAVSDGTHSSPVATSTIDVLATNDPPVLLTNTLSISEGSTVVLSSSNINSSDPESPATGLTYTVSNLSGGHFESIASGSTITSFTQNQINNGGIQFVHDGGESAPAFSLTLSDGAQSVSPSAAVISFSNINDAPVTGPATSTGNEDVSPITVVLSGTDVDGTIAKVRVTTLPANGVLYLDAARTIPVVIGTDYVATAGQLSVYFAPTLDWNGVTTFTFAAIDNTGAIDATPTTATITLNAVNDAPVVTMSAVAIDFTENNPVGLMVDLVVTDVDSATLTSASVSITANFVAGEDQLAFTDILGITGNYNAATGVLTLTGTASLADYQTALRSIAYFNPSDNPTTAARQFQVVVSDGSSPSIAVSRAININRVNDAPTIVTNALTITEGATVVLTSANLQSSDPDNSPVQLNYTVASSLGGQFEFVATPGVAITSFAQDDINNSRVHFVHDGGNSAPTYQVTISDGTLSAGPSSAAVTFTAVNDAPTISSISDQIVNEDAVLGPLAFTVSDSDSANLVVTAATSDGTLIPLSNIVLAGTGANRTVTITPTSDLNGGPVTITLSVSDGSLTAQTSFGVTVQPVNDPPTISNATFSVSETAANGTAVGTVVAGDIDLGDTRSFSVLSGDPLGAFAIDGTGQITVADAALLDFETQPTWTLTVQVRDAAGATAISTVTINLIDQNDNSPIIGSNGGGNSAAISIAENTTSVTTVVATDADAGTTLQYSLSGVDAGLFQIDISTGVLTFLTAPDYESPTDADGNNAYQIAIIASDGIHTDSQALTISVTEVNEFATSPIVDLNGSTDTIAEDAAVGAVVGVTAFADDLDATDTVSYLLLSNAGGRFAIDSVTGVVTVAGAIDFETSTSHTIRVQALSTDGTSTFHDFTIAVTDINEFGATSITDSNPASETLAEDLPVGSPVGVTAFADDLDGTDSISYSLLNDAGGLFTVDAVTGVVTLAQALDYETSATHTIRVQALSTDGSSTFRDFDFTITDVNEFATTPISDLDASAETIAENTAVGTPVGITAFADDLDGTDTVSYSLLNSSGGLFAIDSVTGVVTIAGAIDYETSTSHTIRLQALSTDGSSTFRDFTITVTDSNEFATTPITDLDPAPEVLAENLAVGSVVGVTAFADDLDGTDTVSYSLLSDAGGLFTIDAMTGIVTLNATLDYETTTTHTIRVQALSTDGSSTTRDFAFVITDVNEFTTTALTDVDVTPETIAEDVAVGTVVGITAFADDLDGTDTISYSLLNDAGGRFAIDPVTGDVTVAGAIDYETGTSHTIRVQALSTDGSSTFRDFTIAVTDVNEYATTAVSDANLAVNTVAENSGIGTIVGVTALANDLDGTDTVSYSLDSDANGLVAIDSVTGVVTVNGLIDFETTPQLTFTVRATSTDISFSTQSFTVDVLDRNDNAPVVTSGQSFAVAENTTNGTPVGTVVATDVDTLGVLQNWQITGGTGATAFVINAATGEITVTDSTQLNFEVSTSFTLLVTVSDGGQTSAIQTVTIKLTDVNERPTLVGGTFTVDENSSAGTPVGTISASDVDAGDQLSYSLVGGNPGGAFAIDPTTGAITVADPAMLDFETTNSFTLTAQVTDRGGLTHQQAVTVTLRDLNERPTILDGTYHIPEWSSLGASVGFVSASDVDAGDSLTYRILAENTGGRFLIDSSTGEIQLANPANFTHESQSSFTLSVEVQDLGGLTHSAQMTVFVDNVNTPPTVQDDFYSLVQFEPLVTTIIDGVLVNDSDPDSALLTLTVISGPVNGTLTLNADGSFTYSSNDLFSGVDAFTYQITDGLETSSVATVTLTVGMVAPGGGGSGSNNDNTDNGGSGTDNGGGTTDDSGSSGGPPGVGPTTTTNPPVKVAPPPRSSSDSGMTPPTESSANDEFFSNPVEPLVDLARDIGARRITRAIERPIASAILSELSAVADLIPDPVQDLTLSILENHVMWNQLNSFRDDLNSQRESTALVENIVVGTTTAVSGGLTVGYVIWLIRGGSLLATMMSVMPSWISFDPLPVMDQFEEEDLTEDTESLASIVSGRR